MEKKILASSNKDGLLIIEERTGTLLPPKEPRTISLTGIITSPADWIENRKAISKIDPAEVNVVANYPNRRITVDINEKDHYHTTITGELKMHPELKSLGINEERYYDEKDLMKKLNFFQRFFKDKAAHKTLMEKLQQFKVKINQEFQNANDFQGKQALSKISQIEHDIPLEFELIMPLFAGGEDFSFKVTICVTLSGGEIAFWLESVALHTGLEDGTEAIFKKELERLNAYATVKQW